MADITKAQEIQILAIARQVVPDAEFDDDGVRFDDSCGCYSEWTTESCRLEVNVKGTISGDGFDQRQAIEGLLTPWANSCLSWDGCDCCGNDLCIWVRLIPKRAARDGQGGKDGDRASH